jgi:hypothetical protein
MQGESTRYRNSSIPEVFSVVGTALYSGVLLYLITVESFKRCDEQSQISFGKFNLYLIKYDLFF